MTEPTSSGTGLIALFIALLGPAFGEYGLIVFAALGGALWALGERASTAPSAGAAFLLRVVIMAVVLTGFVAVALSTWTAFTAIQWLAPVAFGIGFFGDSWSSLGKSAIELARTMISRKSQ